MTKKEKPQTDIKNTTTANELVEIRNILFGESVKALEEKMDALSKSFHEQLAALKKDFNQSLEQKAKELAQNNNIKLDELSDYSNKRFDEATKKISLLENELADADSRMAQFEASQQQDSDAFKQELDTVNQGLLKRIEADNKALQKAFDEQINALQQQKTDRAALAKLFTQFAEQLSNDSQ